MNAAKGCSAELLLDGFSRLVADEAEVSALGVLGDITAGTITLTAQTRAGEVAARLHQGAEHIVEAEDPEESPRVDPRLHKLRAEASAELAGARVRDCLHELESALEELVDSGELKQLAPGAEVVLGITGADPDADRIRVLTRPETL